MIANKPVIQKIFHFISVLGTFCLVYGLLYVIQDLTLGRIPLLKNINIGNLPLKVIIFSLISVGLIFKYIKISSPYKKLDHY